MSESSKEERKKTNLNKERGRETSFTLRTAQRLSLFFLNLFFIAAKFEQSVCQSVSQDTVQHRYNRLRRAVKRTIFGTN